MTNKEIKIASAIMKVTAKELNSLVYMSVEWLLFCGAAQGMEKIMIELGYEWDGSKFAEVSK